MILPFVCEKIPFKKYTNSILATYSKHFMHTPYDDETSTAEYELESMGFNATPYNHDGEYMSCAAHTIVHSNVIINNQEQEGDNNNDNSNSNDVYVGNSFCNTSTVSAVEFSPGDANYKTIESLNSTEGGNEIDFSVNNDVVIGSHGDDSASFSSVEAYSNIGSFTISGNSGEDILNSTDFKPV